MHREAWQAAVHVVTKRAGHDLESKQQQLDRTILKEFLPVLSNVLL